MLLISFSSHAFRLDPMVVEFSPKAPGNSKVFRIENNGQDRIAVQLKLTSRKVDQKGNETREPSNDFSVYPDQVSLGPNDSRNVRVTYTGTQELKEEKSYRLIATQLPVDFKGEKKESQLKFLFQFVASLYVHPEGSFAQIEVAEMSAVNANTLKIVLQNKGSAHRLLKDVRLAVQSESGQSISIKDSSYKDWPGENLLAGGRREFLIETVEAIPNKAKLKAQVTFLDHP